MHCSSRGTGCARVLFPPAYFQGLPEQWTRAPARGTDHSRAVLSLCGDCTWRARVAMRCAVQVHYQIRLRETLIAVPYGSPTVAADGSAALQSFLHGFILRRTTPRRGALRLARAAAPYTYSSIASLVVKMQVICIQSSGSRVGNRLSFEWAIITREAGASERIEEETHRGMPRLKAGGTSAMTGPKQVDAFFVDAVQKLLSLHFEHLDNCRRRLPNRALRRHQRFTPGTSAPPSRVARCFSP